MTKEWYTCKKLINNLGSKEQPFFCIEGTCSPKRGIQLECSYKSDSNDCTSYHVTQYLCSSARLSVTDTTELHTYLQNQPIEAHTDILLVLTKLLTVYEFLCSTDNY